MKGGIKMTEKNNNLKMIGAVTIGVLAITLVIITAVYNFQPRSTIVIDGTGSMEVIPDSVTINFEINSEGDSTAEAKEANDNITNDVIDALIAQGLKREDIQTKNLYVSEKYDYSSDVRKLVGYTASHDLSVEMYTNDTEKISSIIDAGVNAGSTLGYLSYSLSESQQNEIKTELISEATNNAKDKASKVAESLNSKLGRIVQISVSSNYNSGVIYYDYGYNTLAKGVSDSESRSSSIEPESQTQQLSVSIVFELK
jgi:hypothetical protein